MLSAAELYDRAVDNGNAGRHAVAARMLAQAASRTVDTDLSARICGTLAYLEAETGDPAAAIETCETALASAEISAHTRAVLTSQLGLIELRRGDLDAAFEHLSSSVGELVTDPARLGRVLINRGLVNLERRDIREAERDFAAASVAFERSGELVEQAKATHNQGYAALMVGQVITALELMDTARPVLALLSPVALAVCDLDRAEVLRAAGMTTEAIGLLRSVARTFGARRLRQMQADAELTLAATLTMVDPLAAAAVARRAARRFRARGNETAGLRADACAITAAVMAGRTESELREFAATTAERLSAAKLHTDAHTLRLQRARLDVRSARVAEARSGLEASRPTSGASIASRLLFREVSSELAEALGDATGALDSARIGLGELHDWQATFGSIDLQSSTAIHGRTLVVTGIRLAIASADPSVLFEWSERTRSLTSRVVPLTLPRHAGNTSELAELRQLRALDPPPQTADGRRQIELRESIRRRRWAHEAAGVVAEVASLDEVVSELSRADADLVTYLLAGDRLTALVVSGEAAVIDLGPSGPILSLLDGLIADLDMAAADLPRAIASVVDATLADRLARLDGLLLRPLRGTLGSGRVVITAPAALSGVPWAILPTLSRRSLTLPVSASRWIEQRRTPLDLSRVAFVAGPGVARAEDEVNASAANWMHSTILRGTAATTDAAARAAPTVDVLHVSAHGRHSADNPLFSGIELADGPWFGYDIDELDRIPPLIVLSACELGRSATDWGQESLGMAQAWLHAGARCVIAAPTEVNDEAACELLASAHSHLARGASPSDALSAAAAATGHATTFQVYGTGY